MSPANCLNCSSELTTNQRFCAHCGQKAAIHRITLPHFIHEFFHAFTHADKGVFHLLKELTLRPGLVAREYVNGKRKKYFNPFTFFLLVMALFVFAAGILSRNLPEVKPDPAVLAQIPTEAGKASYIALMKRAGQAMTIMGKYSNVVGLVAVPFLSLITWLVYRRRGYNYGEHLTANLLFPSYNNLVFTLFIMPLEVVFTSYGSNRILILSAMIFQAFYMGWGLGGFLELRGFRKRLGSFLVALLATFLWMLLSMALITFYIYQNKHFYKFLLHFVGLA